ncbi:MAG: ABC transporter permease [Spirochaetes bacterium]|nr:ABC transporter permease [Spirochaetota bacterium]
MLKRVCTAFVTMFLVSVFCFFAFSVIRGDPASVLAGTDATAEQIAALRAEMGLDGNIFLRYAQWLGRFFSGNLGYSLRFLGQPITPMILQRLPVTFSLAGLALFLTVVISFPVSLWAARREGGIVDRAVSVFTAAGIGIPGFFLGLIFIWIFGLWARLFIPGVFISAGESLSGFIRSLFFPALAIAIPNSAIMVKFLRASLLKELESDYARTARSKGAGYFFILRRHVLRNALVPAVTVLAMIVAETFSGSIIIEQVFTIHGVGMLLIAAISSRDYPVVQTLVVYIAFIVILANTLADIAIQIIDPRIRLEKHDD